MSFDLSSQIKLFSIPFAGGNESSYSNFDDHFAQNGFQFETLTLPGRGSRVHEPFCTDLETLAKDVEDQLREKISGPWALFGHSLGGHLAYLVARNFFRAGEYLPSHLFLSSCEPRTLPPKIRGLHLLPDFMLLQSVIQMGGLSQDDLKNPSLSSYLLAILRADFKVLSDSPVSILEILPIPTTCLLGTKDILSKEQASRWSDFTSGTWTLHQCPGDHFFIFQNSKLVCDLIIQELNSQL